MSATLTAAQAAALRWIATYTDHGLQAAGNTTDLGTRFPNAAMQAKLAGMGLADDHDGQAMATITDAGRAALAPATAPLEVVTLDGQDATVEATATPTAAQAAALTWAATGRQGTRPSSATLQGLVRLGLLTATTAAGEPTAAGRALVGAVSPAAAAGTTRTADGAVVLPSGLVEGSPEADAAEAAASARLDAELGITPPAAGTVVDGDRGERPSLPAGAVVRHIIAVDGEAPLPFASRSRATRAFEAAAAAGRPVRWLSAAGREVRAAHTA